MDEVMYYERINKLAKLVDIIKVSSFTEETKKELNHKVRQEVIQQVRLVNNMIESL